MKAWKRIQGHTHHIHIRNRRIYYYFILYPYIHWESYITMTTALNNKLEYIQIFWYNTTENYGDDEYDI